MAFDEFDQLLDMGDRSLLADAVAEVEDVRAAGEGVKDALRGVGQRGPAGKDGERIEIALDRQAGGQLAVGPGRIDRLVEPDRIDSGLATEDVGLASAIVTVPINPEFGSLNLAQAVILLAYEWSRGADLAQPPLKDSEPPLPRSCAWPRRWRQ